MRDLWIATAASACLSVSTVVPLFGQEETRSETPAQPLNYQQAIVAQLAPMLLTGSQLAADANNCATCHTEPALWDESHQRLFIPPEILRDDAHWQKGVGCSDCHGGDPTSLNFAAAHAQLAPVGQLRDRCAACHSDQRLNLLKGVHARAGARDDRGRGLPLDCRQCHGTNPHAILPSADQRSPVFLVNQVRMCGSCHPKDQDSYDDTVHGKGLYESGLLVTAVCADCHGAHGIYYAADRRSTLHVSNVAATCSKCHQFIEQRMEKSVHGRGGGLGLATDRPAAGGEIKRAPSCTDCHQGHRLLHPESAEFRLQLENRCGNCHVDLESRYALSMHGELTRQGYSPAANCADCHGSHDILPVTDPDSRLAPGKNRLHTCQKCHVHAVPNFTEFDPHANFQDAAHYPTLHAVYSWTSFSLNLLFICFLVHASLWFVRALVHRLRYGGHATLVAGRYALPRFGSIHATSYAALIVTFFILLATGAALKYSDHEWGQRLARAFGGFRSASDWHRVAAVLAIAICFVYVGRGLAKIARLRKDHTWKTIALGPDSPVPNGRDFRDAGRMLGWFFGVGRRPTFEQWTYWEKLDYWGFFLAACLIGISGLMSWYPNLFCVVLSGRSLNVAKVVHSQFAIYFASFLFLIHFFHAHFRPEKFPMDLSVLTGMVSEDHLRRYRPEYVARLEREGKLSETRQEAPSRGRLWLNIVGGLFIFTVGFLLLTVTLLASLSE